ncbi:DUF2975 domain-containing protein [Carnobacterium sp.]|uniref:DUF2975 domain-containing protein n=1 Tax=Carnobacterium sp. TaxID=48221 RepID=UPI0028B00FA4|nr:DUF2975 domain-containing protein [Carnobacterium sp.]
MNKKITFTSKLLNIFLKFLGLLSVFIIIFFIVGAKFGFMKVTDFELTQSSFPLFSMGYSSTTNVELAQLREGYIIFSIGIIVSMIYAVLFFVASSIFSDISNGESPFKKLQVKRLKRVSWLFTSTIFIPLILQNVLHWILIPGGYYFISLGGTELVTAIIFYILAEIFAYGAALQREVDETL